MWRSSYNSRVFGSALALFLLGCQAGDGKVGSTAKTAPAPTPAAGSSTAPKSAPATAPTIADVAVTSPYAGDIQKICNAMRLSGADKDPGGAQVVVANWLAGNIETSEAHTFLVDLAPLNGGAKADRLEGEAKKVGLPGCALATLWRAPGATIGG